MRKRVHAWGNRLRMFMVLIAAARLLHGMQAEEGRARAPFPWPVTLGGAQLIDGMERGSVERFLNSVRAIGVPELRVGEFRFAPLEGDRFCLVATIDTSGRGLYYALAVVCRGGPNGYRMTVLPSAAPHVLGAELIDITGEGVCEVVTREPAGGYEGTQTLPLYWYSVYRVRDGIPREESAKYRQFYASRFLPELDFIASLLAAVSQTPRGIGARTRAEVQFLRAKYGRRIEGQRTAGIGDALQWARSGDARLQMMAVQTLAEIDVPEAADGLETLKSARDVAVSQAAARALQARRKEGR